MTPFRHRTAALAVLAVGALVPPLLMGGSASAAPQPGFGCANNSVTGTTITLTSDCYTASTLNVPNGYTLDGNGHTITAVEITENNNTFPGPVIQSAAGTPTAAATLNVKNVAIVGKYSLSNNPNKIDGIFMDGAGGSIANVSISGITNGNGGQSGRAVEVRNASVPATSLAINGLTVRNYAKSGVIVVGPTAVMATAMDIGPAGNPDGSQFTGVAANGFTLFNGASGSITNSKIAGNRYSSDDAHSTTSGIPEGVGTAILLVNAGTVSVSGNTITGTDSDIGVDVSNDGVAPAVSTVARVTCNTIARTAGGHADTIYGQAINNEGGPGPIALTTGSNTFSGWATTISGASTAVTDPSCPVAAPAPAPAPPVASITKSKSSVKHGRYVSFDGSVSPFQAGGRVALQRFYNHRWHLVKAKGLTAAGRFHFSVKTSSKGNKYFRVAVSATSKNLAGVTRTVKVRVR